MFSYITVPAEDWRKSSKSLKVTRQCFTEHSDVELWKVQRDIFTIVALNINSIYYMIKGSKDEKVMGKLIETKCYHIALQFSLLLKKTTFTIPNSWFWVMVNGFVFK